MAIAYFAKNIATLDLKTYEPTDFRDIGTFAKLSEYDVCKMLTMPTPKYLWNVKILDMYGANF